MEPPAEVVHWMFGVGFVFLGLCLLAETIVGREVWRRRSWRAYLWPSVAFLMGVFMWPVMVFYTSSAIHMLAHGVWAQSMMVAGAAQLGLVRGKLRNPLWELTLPCAFAVSDGVDAQLKTIHGVMDLCHITTHLSLLPIVPR